MKNILLTITLVVLQISAKAQTVNVHFKNGQIIEFPSANVDYVDFAAKPSDPTLTPGQVVDLGLSVYWASCNVGAEYPEEYGDYYAWGETETKNDYSLDTYSYYDKDKQVNIDIGEEISGTPYDAATVNLGSDWRMPTSTEFQELLNNCTFEWTSIKDVNGYKVVAKNGNSIFLPAAGLYYGPYVLGKNGTDGVRIRSGSNHSFLSTDYFKVFNFGPEYGMPIRPVTSNPNAGGNPIDHSMDYIVTDMISAAFTGGSTITLNGQITSSSVLNSQFRNGSNEPVKLISILYYDASNVNEGNNMLEHEVDVAAGETKDYSFSLGSNMARPVIRFTYRYNKKKYIIEACWN